ncbi:MAG: hypothetical protein RLZZ182_1323 [Pseudomonadota bacterium]|jgi:hypothetical protein
MATAQQLAALAGFVDGLETTDEIQVELDGVNARYDAMREQVRIALSIMAEGSYTDEYKLQMIAQTLGPQS